ncbi:helix-turn-helix transcriptional regulator [Eggerthella sp. YY7918]|uniref:helix-turn-helix transcriptional regulator n=1 Tax=Eggerthella sp. (strain YY7918) TaxID=502558 RepID=UPI0005A2C8FC|nr:helix-turn-helix transcriptional regulator [Eggerthella sp. YY7918]
MTEERTADVRAEGNFLVALGSRPMLKYAGFSLLLAWHYTLWFVPHSFLSVPLLDDRVTYSWLINLGSVVLFLFLIALALGRKRRLSSMPWLCVAAPVLLCISTLLLSLWAAALESPLPAYFLAFVMGLFEAVFWILWGERYACVKANFSIRHIGTMFGVTLVACIVIAWVLPPFASSIFTAILPLVSGALLIQARKDAANRFPMLLPEHAARTGLKNMVMVSIITFLASVACYFLVAIIPWEVLPTGDNSFAIGTLCGGFIMLAIAGISALSKDKTNIFKLYPWLLVFEIIAFSLFLADEGAYFPAFFVALGISALFEILLIMYFGILTSKGYTTPAVAFSFSGSFARAGIAVGNTLAVSYEHSPELAAAITPETCLVFIGMLAALLIPLVRQEYNIVALTTAPPTKDEIDKVCTEAAKEFELSGRECEILHLIARGYTANAIATKLVISPYTVNTHIRHIYDKMQIHKRSELLNYLNMQRSDF